MKFLFLLLLVIVGLSAGLPAAILTAGMVLTLWIIWKLVSFIPWWILLPIALLALYLLFHNMEKGAP